MTRGICAGAALAGLLVAAAGCGGNGSADHSTSPTTSAATSSAATSSATTSATTSATSSATSSAESATTSESASTTSSSAPDSSLPATPAATGWTSPAKPTLTKAFELPRQPNAVFAVAISADGKLLATGDGDGTVKLWRTNGKAVATLKGHRDEVNAVAFSPDAKTLASVSSDGTLRLWDVSTGKAKVVTIAGDSAADMLQGVTWSPDGASVVATGWGGSGVHVLSADGTPGTTLPVDPSLSLDSAAFSPDGTTLVVGDIDRGGLEFWQTSDWTMRSQVDTDYSGGNLTWSPDGSKVYGIGNSEDVEAWDAATGATLQKIAHGDEADQLALSPDGALVASIYGIYDGTLHLSSVADGSLLAHDKQDALAFDLAFSATEPLLVVGFGPQVIGYRIG